MTDGELEQIAAAADRAGLGPFTVTPPAPGGADRWDVEFHFGGVTAMGIPMDGRSAFRNLLADIARVGALRKAARLELPRVAAGFARWREEDQRRRR